MSTRFDRLSIFDGEGATLTHNALKALIQGLGMNIRMIHTCNCRCKVCCKTYNFLFLLQNAGSSKVIFIAMSEMSCEDRLSFSNEPVPLSSTCVGDHMQIFLSFQTSVMLKGEVDVRIPTRSKDSFREPVNGLSNTPSGAQQEISCN